MIEFFDDRVSRPTNYLALFAIVLQIASNFSQIIYTFHLKTTKDISFSANILWTLSSLLWIGYGIALLNVVLIVSNATSLFAGVLLLCFIAYNKEIPKSNVFLF